MQVRRNALVRLTFGGALVASAGLASGCMSSPTYGTDKTANAQLMSDVQGILSFTDKKRAPIDYSPRPDLVKPAKGDTALPPPQDNIASASNPDWPESPEQRLARIRDDATANADNPNYDSPVVADTALSRPFGKGAAERHDKPLADLPRGAYSSAQRKAQIDQAIVENNQGSSTKRKYLSDPPLVYREASADAPIGDPGEDEYRKEKRLKREARKKGGGWSLSDLNPF